MKRFIHAEVEDLSQELLTRTLEYIYKQPTAVKKATITTFKSHCLSLMSWTARKMLSEKCSQKKGHAISRAKQRIDGLCFDNSQGLIDRNKLPDICQYSSNQSVTTCKIPIVDYAESRYDDFDRLVLKLDINRIKSVLSSDELSVVNLLEQGFRGREINKIMSGSHGYAHFMLKNLRSKLTAIKDIYFNDLTFKQIKHNIKSASINEGLLIPKEHEGGCNMATTKKTPDKKKAPAKKAPSKDPKAKKEVAKKAPAKASANAPVTKAKPKAKERAPRVPGKSEKIVAFIQPFLDKGKLSRREIAVKVAEKFDLTEGTSYIYVTRQANEGNSPKKKTASKPSEKKTPSKTSNKKAPAKTPAKPKSKKAKIEEEEYEEEEAPAPKKKSSKAKAKTAKSKGKPKDEEGDEDLLEDPFADEDDAEEEEEEFDPESD
jgi:hypothetical protein